MFHRCDLYCKMRTNHSLTLRRCCWLGVISPIFNFMTKWKGKVYDRLCQLTRRSVARCARRGNVPNYRKVRIYLIHQKCGFSLLFCGNLIFLSQIRDSWIQMDFGGSFSPVLVFFALFSGTLNWFAISRRLSSFLVSVVIYRDMLVGHFYCVGSIRCGVSSQSKSSREIPRNARTFLTVTKIAQ